MISAHMNFYNEQYSVKVKITFPGQMSSSFSKIFLHILFIFTIIFKFLY